jgi:hypothetical protein
MSSAPAGLDVREYAYFCVNYEVTVDGEHVFSTQNKWLITRIQFFAPSPLPPGGCYIIIGGQNNGQMFLAAGGCVTYEPNGALRDKVLIFGLGSKVIIEGWYQGTSDGSPLAVNIT